MLRELHISGLGVIDDLDLDLHPGLNVLTGETGAGKTMVTVGLALALGVRADSSLVRAGAQAARVQARFDTTEHAADWAEDGEILLARSVGVDGKSAARVGGQLATASTLAELGGALVEVTGSTRRNVSRRRPRRRDSSIGSPAKRISCARGLSRGVERWRVARGARHARGPTRERERELDLLAYQVHEIEAVDPSDGETERLTVEEARLAHVERLLERSTEAEEMLAGDASLGDAAASAANALAEAARLDPVADGLAERARSLATELAELARDVRGYREGLAADPARPKRSANACRSWKGLQRSTERRRPTLSFLLEASSRLTALATADERLAELSEEAEQVRADLQVRAAALTRGRDRRGAGAGGGARARAATAGMPGATIAVELDPAPELGAVGGSPWSSASRRPRVRRHRRWQTRRAASSRERCSRVAAHGRPRRRAPRSSSTRWTPGSGGSGARGRAPACEPRGGAPGIGRDAPAADRMFRRPPHPRSRRTPGPRRCALSDDERVHELSRCSPVSPAARAPSPTRRSPGDRIGIPRALVPDRRPGRPTWVARPP